MHKNKRILVVIPARSGSKGIKNKNIKKLNNKPLISYSIKYAIKCKFVDRIIVSTDSLKYAKIAISYGAKVPFLRSKKLAGDSVQDFPVISESLIKSEKFFEQKFDYIILLRPTSPFREKKLIEKGLKLIESVKSSTSVRSVIETKCHPYRHWKIIKSGKMISVIDQVYEPFNIPRQRLPKFFFQSGDIEIIKRNTLLKGSINGNFVLPLVVNSYNDIDTLESFKKNKK